MLNIFRPKWAAGGILAAMLLLGYYYSNLSVRPARPFSGSVEELRLIKNDGLKENAPLGEEHSSNLEQTKFSFYNNLLYNYTRETDTDKSCQILHTQTTDIDTLKEFPNFEFQPQWMRSKEYWNKSFEDRYEQLRKDPNRPPLKVIIVPHSHNDPGWLHTFEHYFQLETKQILNQIVAKLQQYPDMTFIWSEISFLTAWWDSAHPTKQKALKKLIKSGQLEITTGGWVMPDEATTHIYALIDQFIEGHQWMKNNIGESPRSGWSIDPFGHGATVPYLLSRSGIEGAIIQRLHYAWKQWFAQHQWGDFVWMPSWASSNPASILTHNQPFDIYSIKHSCGPHPYICLNFDFRKIKGEYTEYSVKAEFITDKNLKAKAELLLEQYARTGSLLPHNVALIALGDDFRYNHDIEFDQQYVNYKKLSNFINENKHIYNAEVVFGTPKDYFKAIKERYDRFPTLKGDFFVYSDIFTEGRPAYWSGYFTTRPYLKIMDRELEHNLRNAEILFTLALNTARQHGYKNILRLLEKNYENLIKARRNLGLFQHHDAITGTSKSSVMRDYGLKLFESLQDMVKLQESCLEIVYKNNTINNIENEQLRNFILSDVERESYDKLPRKLAVLVDKDKEIILFNSLAQKRSEVITIRTNTTNVKILNSSKQPVNFQINPVWFRNSFNKLEISTKEFEIMFIVDLPPLSVVTYNIAEDQNDTVKRATIYCDHCVYDFQQNTTTPVRDGLNPGQVQQPSSAESPIRKSGAFIIKNTLPGDIQLENHRIKLLIDGVTGFLKSITKKKSRQIRHCAIEFSAYQSAQLHSGAYLFMPDINTPEKDVLEQYARGPDGMESQRSNIIIITSGPIATQVTVVYGPFLMHTLRIYNNENNSMADAIYMENEVDFESPPKNRETELFVRINTDIQNGEPPEFYTDQNGFQYQKRVKVEKISIEGNYYPITTMAFLQDRDWRFTYITGHAQGASSFEPGRLEVMLDRRTLYDDSRGMGEGLVDNRRTRFRSWLLSESTMPEVSRSKRNTASFDQVQFVRQSRRRIRKSIKNEKSEGFRRFILTEPRDLYQLPSHNAIQLSQALNYPVNIFTIDNMEKFTLDTKSVNLLNAEFPEDVHLVNLRTLTDPQFQQFPAKDALLILHRMGYRCTGEVETKSKMPKMFPFSGIREQSLMVTSLTGLHPLQHLNSLHDLELLPMELHTINITFFDSKLTNQY
ncbi:alpha-Mannosidase class II b [Arctopsyche grandis]|uniref:alpha-Mannosidase class II b n=1 Tax=Arctopsyche grandis TaxID=121162 RepID=UPI00406D848A